MTTDNCEIANELYNYLKFSYTVDLEKINRDKKIYNLLHKYFEDYYKKGIYLAKIKLDDDIKYYQRKFYLLLATTNNMRIVYSDYRINIIPLLWYKASYFFESNTKKWV